MGTRSVLVRTASAGERVWSAVRSNALILALGLIVLMPVGLAAQGGASGEITGSIQDPSGAAVPGAQVIVANQDTGTVAAHLKSTQAGTFSVPFLAPASYRVEVTASGFKKFEQRGVAVRVTETSSIVVNLEVGAPTQLVSVTSEMNEILVSTPTLGETITAHTVENLPLSNRNFFALLSLSAGTGTEFFDSTALGRGQVTLNVNGQRPGNNNYQLEGINANDLNLPVLDNVALPNPDAIGEFKTQTSLYDASQGRNGGGDIQVGLKHGTGNYHGDVYEFFRDRSLNANDFFLNRQGQRKPQLHQNEFGGSFGGPVPKVANAFFFGNYQGWRESSGLASGTLFSTQIPVLPASRTGASLEAAFFPNGLPPGFNGLDPVALSFLNLPASKCPGFNDGTHCVPTLPGTPGLTVGRVNLAPISRSALGRFRDDQYTITGDKTLGSGDQLTGSFYSSTNTDTQPFGVHSSLPFTELLPGSNAFAKFGWTHTLSSAAVNQFRAGYNRFHFAQIPTEPISLTDVGAVRGNSSQFPAAFRISVTGGGFSLGTGVNDNRGTTSNTFEWADDYSRTFGKHTLRLGGLIDRYQLNRFNNFASRGSVIFAGTPAGSGGAGIPALTGLQNFLLGRVTSTQGASGIFNFFFRATDYGLYVQDDWRYSPRLTLNLGLRWEEISTAHDTRDFLSNFRGLGDGTPGPIRIIHPAGTSGVGTPGVSSCTLLTCLSTGNFGPRVGFAYDFSGNGRMVLRGGYGLYYDRVSNQALLQTTGGLPFQQTFSATPFSVTTQNPFPNVLPSSDFPLSTDQVIPALTGFDGTTGAPIFQSRNGTPAQGPFFFPARNFRPPYTQEWNLNVQRGFGQGWRFELAYVGAHGVSLLGPGRPGNPGQICTVSLPCAIPSSVGSGVTVPAGTPFVTKNPDGSISITGNTPANISARVPPVFLGLTDSAGAFQENQSFSWYHSMQATLSHQWSRGLYLQAAYTWSRLLDNASGSTVVDELNGLVQYGDLFNPRSNYGPGDYDRTHRFVISYDYDLPLSHLFHLADASRVGRFVNGWAINGVTVFESGTPFNVIDTSAVLLQDTDFVNTSNFPLLPAGVTISQVATPGGVEQRLNGYIDLSKFVAGGNCVDNQNVIVPASSPACTGYAALGNLSRNAFRGPFQQNWDLSLTKSTRVTERMSIDFRAEFFNILNHPSFQSPQAGTGGSITAGFAGSLGNYGIVDVASGTSAILATVNRPRVIQLAASIKF